MAVLIEKMKDWFYKEISIFGIKKKRVLWFGFLLIVIIGVITTGYTSLYYSIDLTQSMGYIYFSILGIICLLSLYIFIKALDPSHEAFLSFSIIISAITFYVEKYPLSNVVYPPFTERTVFSLWFVFIFLGLGIFYKKLPVSIVSFLPAIYLFGVYVCFAFILTLLPIMVIGWIMIPFMGIGFLPYSPLLATSAFLLAFINTIRWVKQSNQTIWKNLAFFQIIALSILLIIYSSWYLYEWGKTFTILEKTPITQVGHNTIYSDMPRWMQVGMKIQKNHVNYMLLQPTRGSGTMTLFETGKVFDPIAYLASIPFNVKNFITDEEKVSLLQLLFEQSHSDLDRLWTGKSLIIKNISSHIQTYTDLRLAYTETTLEIYNEGNGIEEAYITVQAPPGSICTKMSLWVNGKEEESRLTLKSKAKKAYTEIVGVEVRDPSLVEWMPSGAFRLRVFPVNSGETRTVRIGITSFLEEKDNILIYKSSKFTGVPFVKTEHQYYLDLFSINQKEELVSKDILLKEKIVSDSQSRQWAGVSTYKENWSLEFSGFKAESEENSFRWKGKNYSIQKAIRKKEEFQPEKIYFNLDASLPREKWIQVYKEIYNLGFHSISIIGTEKFESNDLEKAIHYLQKVELPSYSFFPFYQIEPNLSKILLVTASNPISIPWTELKNSNFYKMNETFFNARKTQIHVASLTNYLPKYVDSFKEWGRVVQIAKTQEELMHILKDKHWESPLIDSEHFFLPDQNRTIVLSPSEHKDKKGNDLLARLAINRMLMQKLGQIYFDPEADYKDLLSLAEDAYIVSPISSLIVLETEEDYKRFGIDKNVSGLGQSGIKKPGLVPEPTEWFFFCLTILFLIYIFKKRIMGLNSKKKMS